MAWEVVEVSRYQNISDYRAAASSVNGVLIRVGYRGYGASGTLAVDNKFEDHYNGFYEYGRKMGFYFFSAAVNETEAIEEANFTYNLIKNKKCDFPVYFQSDYTNPSHTGRSDALPKAERTAICKAFCERIKELGYRAGVLADDSWYNVELNIEQLQSASYSIIVGRHSEYTPIYVNSYDAWEYTDQGSIAGYDGYVSLARFYRDVAGWTIPDYDDPVDINNFPIYISPSTPEYADGEPITPVVLVDGLILGVDFLVDFEDNVYVGTAHAKLRGIGNYTGTADKEFPIIPQYLPTSGKALEFHPNRYNYNNEKPVIPNYSIYKLTEWLDYTIEFSNNTEIGTATGKATGIGNYSGELSSNFYIIEGGIDQAGYFYLSETSVPYTGEEIKPTVISEEGLEEGKDFEVFYENNINIGTATVIVNGINSYTGSLLLYFEITKKTITGVITLTPSSFIYSGLPCCPEVSIEGLEPSDFKVEYKNNINAGTAAAIIIYGIGNYAGSLSATFKIYPKPVDPEMISPKEIPDQYYNGRYVEPTVGFVGLKKNVDYIVRYKDNHELGSASAEVTGIGNYTGMAYATFNVVECPISETDVRYGNPSLYTPYRIDTGITTITAKGGYILKENIDYKILSKTTLPKKEFTVVTLMISGLGGFTDVEEYNYRVIAEEPKPDAMYDDGIYNFGDIDYDDETAFGNWDFGDIDAGVPHYDPSADMSTTTKAVISVALYHYRLNPDPVPEPDPPSVVVPEGDYDFERFSGIYLEEYDENTGKDIDEDGNVIDWDNPKYKDDGVWNFGDIDEGDETAEGDYDFGDLEEGRDLDSKVKDGDNCDFNIFPDGYPVGKEYELEDTPIYANYCSEESTITKSGSYLIYKPQIMQNKIRITKMENGIGAPARSTGWVKLEDLDRLGLPKLNDPVYVNGAIRRYINSENEFIVIKNKLMYIVAIADEKQYEFAYGVAYDLNSNKIGWASLDELVKYNPDVE